MPEYSSPPLTAAAVALAFISLAWLTARLVKRVTGSPPGLVFWVTCLIGGPWIASRIYYPTAAWSGHLGALLIISAAMLVWVVFDRVVFSRFIEARRDVHVPVILRQIIGVIVLLGAVGAVLTWIYKKEVTGLLATSGIAAVILGFAMQDLLSNVIAGFSIHLTKAYKIGDWLLLAGDNRRAEVHQINWRSTRLIDNDQISFEIPNSELVKGRIINLNHPSDEHAVRLRFGLDYDLPPNLAKETILGATRGVQGILENPAPNVFLVEFGDSAVIYELRVWMRHARLFNVAGDGIRTNLWYELQRRGFKIPFPTRSIERRSQGTPLSLTAARRKAAETLRASTPLSCLTPEQAALITSGGEIRLYGKGEAVVTRDEEGRSMFIILDGDADVIGKTGSGSRISIATLGVGDCFGEMSLLTGEPRNATVRAKTDLFALEIHKEQLAPLLQEIPELVERMGGLLERRQAERGAALERGDQSAVADEPHSDSASRSFAARIRKFFS